MRPFAGMVEKPETNCVVLLGATASGKTGLGVHIARLIGGEILSADSRQVYRFLDIGSGKDLGEYGDMPYHLIDIADLSSEYSVFDYQRDFYSAFQDVVCRKKSPVIVGGTGMYLDSIIRGYTLIEVPENKELRAELSSWSLEDLVSRLYSLKKEVHNKTDLIERARLIRAIEIAEYKASALPPADAQPSIGLSSPKPLILGVHFERSELRSRIRIRLEERLKEGLVDEVRDIHANGVSWERLERLGLEYRFTAEYLQGKIPTEKEFVESLYVAIGQFAKRQETWFRGMERKGVTIRWIENADKREAENIVLSCFKAV
jgi:tRNA dimethylallyltransferase